ncbi:MAG: hypothetical protein HKO02_14535 [Hyphomonadaceae bacterium]|nr:hypothetical protein [Hyphomonadaceae bacterium]
MQAKTSFGYAAIALGVGSLVHIVGLALGPDALAFLGAPQEFVQGARDGDWLWTSIVTLGIAGLLAILAWLSWRAKTLRENDGMARSILWLFAGIFTLRGLMVGLFVPAIMERNIGDPSLLWFHVGASVFVLTIGLALLHGLYKTRGISA